MATTTPNFGWAVPTSTDLVKDGAVAIETLGDSIDASLVDLKGGTSGQVLSKASNTDMDFTWVTSDDANAIQNAIVDAKGDLIAASAADTPARLAVGANNTVLVADSTTATGLAYTASLTGLTTITTSADSTINGNRLGRGAGNVATNTTVGSNTLTVNTTGSNNTAVGASSLAVNTTGVNNTALGAACLVNNTTGNNNTAVGQHALFTTSSGQSNTAVGLQSLYSNTSGSTNIGIGMYAGYGNTTGNQNTAIGYVALNANSTGSANTAVGLNALLVNTADSNTAIGQQAGDTTTTGTNNSFLGVTARASSPTVSNTITLGNSSIATLRCQVTSITSLSDERDKKDIAPLEHGLDFVKQLKPVSFEWNTRPETVTDFEGNEIEIQGKVGIADIGFIAQDIVALEDSLDAADSLQLSYRDNPEKLEVTQGRLIPILVKAIQDLTAKVEALEAAQA